MNGVAVTWNENSPSGTESMNSGDDRIRSLKTAMRTGLDDEHVFPAAGGLAGYHRYGAARVFVGTQSLVSSSGTDGKLMQASDTSRLFAVGSGGTYFLGGPTVMSIATTRGVAPPQRARWAMEIGGYGDVTPRADASGYISVTFPNSGFSGAPVVVASPTIASGDSAIAPLQVSIHTITKTDCILRVYYDNGGGGGIAAEGVTANWMSIGTRAL